MRNNKYKVIFIHVIKTAGVSIASALNMKGTNNHSSASEIRKQVGEKIWNGYFKFTFVRNPFDKIVSQYHYNQRNNFTSKDLTFKEYVKEWSLGKKISKFPQQHLFYIDDKLDFIGKFENLQEDFNVVCDKIGIPQQQLPHKNQSKHKCYTEYYDEETKQIVAEKYAKDIEYFGYKFGE